MRRRADASSGGEAVRSGPGGGGELAELRSRGPPLSGQRKSAERSRREQPGARSRPAGAGCRGQERGRTTVPSGGEGARRSSRLSAG